MNNVFVFFVEPASYTIDLINNVHIPKKIGYAFINSSSYYKEQFDFKNQPKGVYIMKIYTELGVFSKRVIIK